MKIPILGRLYILAVVLIGALLGRDGSFALAIPGFDPFRLLSGVVAVCGALKSGAAGHHRRALGAVHLHPVRHCGAQRCRRRWSSAAGPRWCNACGKSCTSPSGIRCSSMCAAWRSRWWSPATAYHSTLLQLGHLEPAVKLMVTATVFFGMNTFPVAAAIALTERKSLRRVWRECYFWAFPYYLLGAAAWRARPAPWIAFRGLANRVAGGPGRLSDLPLLLPLPGSHGGREKARRGDGRAASSNH